MNDLYIAKKLIRLEQSANKRGIEFDLSFSDVKRLLNTKRCYYSRVELTDVEEDPNQRSLERVDNNKGYVKGNVVACSRRLNSIKSNLEVKEIKYFYNGLKKKGLL